MANSFILLAIGYWLLAILTLSLLVLWIFANTMQATLSPH